MTEKTLFERIYAGEIPSTILAETERVFAINDINPQAPLHVLVVPKTGAFADVTSLAAGDPTLLAEMVGLAKRIAEEYANGEFRLLFNNGATAGQTIFHVHAHVLGNFKENTLVGF